MSAYRFGLFICVLVLISVPALCRDTDDWLLSIDKQDGVSFRYPSQWRNSPSMEIALSSKDPMDQYKLTLPKAFPRKSSAMCRNSPAAPVWGASVHSKSKAVARASFGPPMIRGHLISPNRSSNILTR